MLELILTRLKTLFKPCSSVLCALSGGADSVAMTLALHALREKADISGIVCAHFNHGLRGADSDADQEFCVKLCDKLNLPLYIGAVTCLRGGEAEYRRLRYDFLIKTALDNSIPYITTAHTSDDNAETLLLNLTRGTGLDGLTGIPAIREGRGVTQTGGVYIIRPLLDVTRSDVLAYLQKCGQGFRDDNSNRTDAYRRNRMRRHIIPELQKENPKLLETLSHTIELLKRDGEYLNEQAAIALDTVTISENTISVNALLSLHLSLSGRVIKQMCERANGAPLELSSRHINAIMSLCLSGPSALLNLPHGLTARRIYDGLRIEKSVCNVTFAPVKIDFGQTVLLDGLGLWAAWTKKLKKINNLVYSFSLSSDTIECGLTIRPRLSGDFIRLAGRSHSKSLRKLFIDAKIPKHERSGIPVLADDIGVVAVGGFGVDKRCFSDGDETILQIYREEPI
jgi:tRNA(Ile)-lysidine synthase